VAEDADGDFLAEAEKVIQASDIASATVTLNLTIEIQPTRLFEVAGVGEIGLQLPDLGTRVTTSITAAPQQEVAAILPETVDLTQRMPEQMIRIEISGEGVDTGIDGNFKDSPLTVSLPFSPGQQAADTMVLLSEAVGDQPAQLEMLATTQSENQLTADLYHLSYLLTVKNQAPTVVDGWQAAISTQLEGEQPVRRVTAGSDSIIINLQQIFSDEDLSWGDELVYQLSLLGADLVRVEGAIALTGQGGTAEAFGSGGITGSTEAGDTADYRLESAQLRLKPTSDKSREGEVVVTLHAVDVNDLISPTIDFKVKVKSVQPTAWQTEIQLKAGLNLVSLPLQPIDSATKQTQKWAAADLADKTEATVIVAYDSSVGEDGGFIPYIPQVMAGSGDSGFLIQEDQGYIINVLQDRSYSFIGQPWGSRIDEDNTSAGPSLVAPLAEADNPALAPQKQGQHWAFVLSGDLTRDSLLSAGLERMQARQVMAVHQPTGREVSIRLSGNRFYGVLADTSQRSVVTEGDVFEITALDQAERMIAGPARWTVTAQDLAQAYRHQSLVIGDIIPIQTTLLANYPNPFNPETWIPFELSRDGLVTIQIFDNRGRIVRRLKVGHRPAGRYLSQSQAAYWDGKNQRGETAATGVYFYTLSASSYTASRKMVIVK
jgi:hypothetical protein